MAKVPEGKTLYHGKLVIKEGQEIPPHIENKAKAMFDKSYTPPPPEPEPEEEFV